MLALLPCLAVAASALEAFDKACRLAPTAPYVRSWSFVDVRLKAVCLSDTDGARATPITAEQIQRGVAFANAAYARARVRFVFDPERDLLRVRSTLLNSLEAGKPEIDEVAHRVGQRFPGAVVLLFRWGGGKGPTGGCFSGFDGRYVAMCHYWESPPPVPQNVWLIGHEVGHYLGLSHTFGPTFTTVKGAEDYFKKHKDDSGCFDGDGLADTAPEPCIGEIASDVDRRIVALDGKTLTLDRENLMNYTGSRYKTISRSQALRVRWSAIHKVNSGRWDLPSNDPPTDAWILPKLKVLESVASESSINGEPLVRRLCHGGARLTCLAKAGSRMTFETPSTLAGTFLATLYAFANSDLGVFRVLIDHRRVGLPVDGYDPVDYLPTGPIDLGPVSLKAGTHRLTIEVVGKNPESSAAHWSIEAVALTRIP